MSGHGCGPECHYQTEPELWVKLTKYSHKHEVSNHGRVKNTETGRIMKRKGTPYVFVSFKDVKNIRVHHLVVDCFLPKDCTRELVNHLNGIKTSEKSLRSQYYKSIN